MGLSGLSLTAWILTVFLAFITPSKSNDRIVGGEEVDIADYPYQVAVYWNDRFICGGSIISEDLVVTAAHCIRPNGDYSIRVGSGSFKSGGEVYQIDRKNIIVNEQFNLEKVDYDIALLRASQSIFSGNTVAKPVALPSSGQQPAAGKLAKISGWGSRIPRPGRLSECCWSRSSDDQLNAAEVPIVEQSVCQEHYNPIEITDRMICAGYPGIGGKDSCQGDSGGPMVVDGVLVGVVSWGRGCADKRFPGVYSNVAVLRDWIKERGGV
ncbi:polyserase-related [Holotrichia oblita]|uniref:Polyserase-related n=1 Tax=Holotrichia oblita TaxID=644536 RepID=A0ACB9SVB7_HOLOL|nr:polyserase-related [Holotrichia oblita]